MTLIYNAQKIRRLAQAIVTDRAWFAMHGASEVFFVNNGGVATSGHYGRFGAFDRAMSEVFFDQRFATLIAMPDEQIGSGGMYKSGSGGMYFDMEKFTPGDTLPAAQRLLWDKDGNGSGEEWYRGEINYYATSGPGRVAKPRIILRADVEEGRRLVRKAMSLHVGHLSFDSGGGEIRPSLYNDATNTAIGQAASATSTNTGEVAYSYIEAANLIAADDTRTYNIATGLHSSGATTLPGPVAPASVCIEFPAHVNGFAVTHLASQGGLTSGAGLEVLANLADGNLGGHLKMMDRVNGGETVYRCYIYSYGMNDSDVGSEIAKAAFKANIEGQIDRIEEEEATAGMDTTKTFHLILGGHPYPLDDAGQNEASMRSYVAAAKEISDERERVAVFDPRHGVGDSSVYAAMKLYAPASYVDNRGSATPSPHLVNGYGSLPEMRALARGIAEAAEGVFTFGDIREAVGLASANLDTQLSAAQTDLDTITDTGVIATNMRGTDGANTTAPDNAGVAAVKAKTDNLPASPAAVGDIPTTAEIEAALLNEGDGSALLAAIIAKINADLDVSGVELAAIAAAVRVELAVELARIDSAISSRLAAAGYTAPLDSTAAQAAAAAAITAYGPATPGDVPTAAAIRTEIDDNSAKLASILTDTAAIDIATAGGVTVTAFNPSTTAGSIELAQGDDYKNADGRAISRTITGAAFDVASARITFKDVQTGAVSMAATVGTVSSGTDPIGFYFELAAAQTAALAAGRNRHAYTIEVTTDAGGIVTVERGGVTVTEDAD